MIDYSTDTMNKYLEDVDTQIKILRDLREEADMTDDDDLYRKTNLELERLTAIKMQGKFYEPKH